MPALETLSFQAGCCLQLKTLCLSNLPSLRQVRVEDQSLYNTAQVILKKCPQLVSFVCNKECFTRCQEFCICDLPSLEKVMIGSNSFWDCNQIQFKQCEKLQVISIGDFSFMGKVGRNGSVLSHLPSLKWFSVGEMSLGGVEQICIEDVATVPEKCLKVHEKSFKELKVVDGDKKSNLYSVLYSKVKLE